MSFDDIKDEAEFTRVFGLMMAVCAHLLSIENVDDLAAEVDRYAIGHYGAVAA